MKRLAKWWCFPIVVGLFILSLSFFNSYTHLVLVGCVGGYVLGYWDPWNAKGERR